MSDVIPPPPPRRDSGGCWKWGAISCIGLGCLGAIALAAIIYFATQTPMFKQAMASGMESARIAQKLPEVGGALTKYRDEKGDYPKKLTDLAPKYISEDKLRWSGGPYLYTKPPKDAPDSFPIVTVEVPTFQGGPPMVVRLHKDGTVENPTAGRRQFGAPPPSSGN